MKFGFLAGSTLLALAGAASPAHAEYDWSGFYVGITAGQGWDNSDATTSIKGSSPLLEGSTRSGNSGEFTTAGLLLGYDWQIDNFVLGVDTALISMDLDGSDTTHYPAASISNTFSYESELYGTLRGRAGYAFNSVMFFGTAGLAFTTVDVKTALGGLEEIDTVNKGGWTIGAGFEYALGPFLFGAEYLHIDYGKIEHRGNFPAARLSNSVDLQVDVLQTTVKFRF
jgi:outer membrane immunogenic protein